MLFWLLISIIFLFVVDVNGKNSTIEFRQDPSQDRIFGGWETRPHEFPWMAKVKSEFILFSVFRRWLTFKTRSCGGALIAPRWVISARHCVTWHPLHKPGRKISSKKSKEASEIRVYLGGYLGKGEKGGLMSEVERAIGRPDYGNPECKRKNQWCPDWAFWADTTFTNDIVLLKLKRDFTARTDVGIRPLALPDIHSNYMGRVGYVTGWGAYDPNDRSARSESLKAAEIVVIDAGRSKFCTHQNTWGKICAVGTRKNRRGGSACPGDSGSPFVLYDEYRQDWVLIGLLSNGHRDCFRGYPSIYTKIDEYMNWINLVMHRRNFV